MVLRSKDKKWEVRSVVVGDELKVFLVIVLSSLAARRYGAKAEARLCRDASLLLGRIPCFLVVFVDVCFRLLVECCGGVRWLVAAATHASVIVA